METNVSGGHIVAMGGGGFSMDDPVLDRFVLELVDAPRPKVCFLPTATSAVPVYVLRFMDAFPAHSFEPTYLDLFSPTVTDVASFLAEQDVIYVGGGNTANLLAIWRTHGLDVALRGAWEAGVVLCGVSAGANCWFEASTTDSFHLDRVDPLPDGLGFLAGSFTPHYHGEAERRPSLHRLLHAGALPAGLACDDYAAVHFQGTQMVEAVASADDARVWHVEASGAGVLESPIDVRRLG